MSSGFFSFCGIDPPLDESLGVRGITVARSRRLCGKPETGDESRANSDIRQLCSSPSTLSFSAKLRCANRDAALSTTRCVVKINARSFWQ